MQTVTAITAGLVGVIALIGVGFAAVSAWRTLTFLARVAPGFRPSSVEAAQQRHGERIALHSMYLFPDLIDG